jgi:hypothetical protein
MLAGIFARMSFVFELKEVWVRVLLGIRMLNSLGLRSR